MPYCLIALYRNENKTEAMNWITLLAVTCVLFCCLQLLMYTNKIPNWLVHLGRLRTKMCAVQRSGKRIAINLNFFLSCFVRTNSILTWFIWFWEAYCVSHSITCFYFIVGSGVWLSEKWSSPEDVPYIPPDDNGVRDANKPALEGFIRFWTFIIIYQVCEFYNVKIIIWKYGQVSGT